MTLTDEPTDSAGEAKQPDLARPDGRAGSSDKAAGDQPPREAASARRSGPTGWRKWLFRLAAMTIIPAAFFLLLEGGLRLFGYGFEPAFFVELPVSEGDELLTTNQKFAWRFFPPTGARPPVPVRLSPQKPSGVYRVFVFGGSAAMGSPEPAFSFPRILATMLRQRLPNARFEIVNAAMEAMNSHVARAIAREAAELDADLFIIYMGNNEVVGPYGISDSFSTYSPSLSAVRASMWVRTTRTGQLVHNAIAHIAGGGKARIWKGMETFVANTVPPDDPRLEKTREHFRQNLSEILDVADERGARVLLCTIATNLKDCAPFHATHRPSLSEADKARWQAHYDVAVARDEAGDRDGALAKYREAMAVDDRYADLHFRLAAALEAAGRFDEAKKHYVLARDLDALRFRADSRTNRIIAEIAAARGGDRVRLVDAERAAEQSPHSPHGLVGSPLFYEHVHMTFEGNYAVAAAVFRELVKALPPELLTGAARPIEPPDEAACAEELAYTGWERYRLATSMARITSRPPFTFQLDHAARRAAGKAAVEKLRHFALPEAKDAAAAVYRKALDRDPNDVLTRTNYGLLLFGFGDHEAGSDQWKILLRQLPGNAQVHKSFGLGLIQAGRYDEAADQLSAALEILPRDLNARSNLGAALLWQGKRDRAMAIFREILEANPRHADAQTNLAIALAQNGENARAVEHFRKSLEIDGEHLGALRNLARLLSGEGKLDEAVACYEQAIAAGGDYAIHLDLASLLLAQNKVTEAIGHFRRAVELAPYSAATHLMLGRALLGLGRYEQAAERLRKAVAIDDGLGEGHRDLAMAYQRLKLLDKALVHYGRALRLLNGDPATWERLAFVLVAKNKLPEAVAEYTKLLRAHPGRAEAHNNFAAILARTGSIDQAILHFAAAVRLQPTPQRHYNLATLLARRTRDREAVVHYRQAMAMRSAWPEAMAGLAWTLATSNDDRLRNGAEAIRLAKRACELTGYKQAGAVDALAAAQAEVGEFLLATGTARRARKLALAAGEKSQAEQIARRIKLYQAEKPCRRTLRRRD